MSRVLELWAKEAPPPSSIQLEVTYLISFLLPPALLFLLLVFSPLLFSASASLLFILFFSSSSSLLFFLFSSLLIFVFASCLASARATLQPNAMYALVASTFDPGKESTFNIVVFSDEPIKLKVK